MQICENRYVARLNILKCILKNCSSDESITINRNRRLSTFSDSFYIIKCKQHKIFIDKLHNDDQMNQKK